MQVQTHGRAKLMGSAIRELFPNEKPEPRDHRPVEIEAWFCSCGRWFPSQKSRTTHMSSANKAKH